MRVDRRWAWITIVPCATAAMLPFREHLELGTILLLHLLVVVLVSVLAADGAAVIAAVLAVALVNWFFTRPYHSLRIEHSATIVDLTAFLVVALTTSRLVRISQRHEQRAESISVERERAVEIDRSRAALLSALGHDLRTPISAIKASTSGILAKDVSWTLEDVTDAVHLVDEEADRLSDLLSNLLDQSRLEAGMTIAQVEPVEVSEILRAKRLPRGPWKYAFDPNLPMVLADPGLMERVIHNVLTNAQRHGGPDVEVLISAHCEGETVVIEIDDNGKGVDEQRMPTLFDPYRSSGDRARGGTGLGLAIVKGFTEAMGGTVSAAPSVRGGLHIAITLKVAS